MSLKQGLEPHDAPNTGPLRVSPPFKGMTHLLLQPAALLLQVISRLYVDMELFSCRAYPWHQVFAFSLKKDKQRKACPRQVIIYTHYSLSHHKYTYIKKYPAVGVHLIIYIKELRRRGR